MVPLGLAYLSTAYYVFRLNCRVRNKTRCIATANAVITSDFCLRVIQVTILAVSHNRYDNPHFQALTLFTKKSH